MTKGMKPSDPIIDYPDIKNTDVSTIKDWLGFIKFFLWSLQLFSK